MQEKIFDEVSPPKARKALQRFRDGYDKRVRRYIRLHYQATDEVRRQRYVKLASEAPSKAPTSGKQLVEKDFTTVA